ncbi:LysR substrate-binding domain-containing protein [Marinobacterium rhizophilum]|uniref:LysR family transcriptional regulator n=1 Tax=Marinobacterium rhizophilum TaxID=420402 RepID=A0ABY5HPG1_9GAMM|nr:LysR substrate-binding domain-containing protein [Marinobacterium rhizophilum]UTW13070.1 LysR family transcriptional regulator [Marinobacterium rhizophilum]
MKRFDFNQLVTFVSIVEAGSISKAAVSLHRTQAAISIQLKKLEESVGKPLLLRNYNSISLTHEGETLLAYARKILALADEAYHAVNDDDIAGVVRFGVPDGYARSFIQDVLKRFIQRFPKIRLQIKNAPSPLLFRSLHQGDLDLILVTRSPQEPGGIIVRKEKLVWVGASDYVPDLSAPIPLALYEQGCDYRRRVLDVLNKHGLESYVAFECQGVTGFDIAISNGLAISAMSASLVKAGEWRILDECASLPDLGNIEIELHRSAGESSEAISCFAKELEAHITNLG